MAKHASFTLATDVKVYFCDLQSLCQRGSNETEVTGLNKSSASERESLRKGAGGADQKVHAGAGRDAAAAD